MNELVSYNNIHKQPMNQMGENYFVIYHEKGGSGWIRNNVASREDTTSKLLPITFQNEWYKSLNHFDNPKEDSEFRKLVRGTSNKDFIIVTRNPQNKFLSGVIQDFKFYHEIHEGYFQKNNPNVIKNLTDFFERYLRGEGNNGTAQTWEQKIGTLSQAHMTMYNETYYNFLENNPKISKSKLILVDLDKESNRLEAVFAKYFKTDIDKQYPYGLKFGLYEDVKECILNLNPKLKEIVAQTIGRDYYYYKKLKNKYHNNFYK
jgi:hypothetical protein